jgi:hypothetical protein
VATHGAGFAVMEEAMRHFYVRAVAAKQTKQPDKVIDAAMIQGGADSGEGHAVSARAFERRDACR